jgi:glycosyltransferase involved in cell wall biosynthesis
MLLFMLAYWIASKIGRKPVPDPGQKREMVLTGRFDSTNWIQAFLQPLSQSPECSKVWLVSTNQVPPLPGIEAVYPPAVLRKICGATGARLLTFYWTALRKRPVLVGGIHIMVNGLLTVIAGKLFGARSLYFCVGGPAEVIGGGVFGLDNAIVNMETPDEVVERRMLRLIGQADEIITKGGGAARFFRERGVRSRIHIVAGGVDSSRYTPSPGAPACDIVVTGRLARVKRVDVFLQTMHLVCARLPDVQAVIVGGGELREELEQQAKAMGLGNNVTFAGFIEDAGVLARLRSARLFVLSSDTEGLSLSLIEAMMCGLPAVVSAVGDLGDLVESGVNGYLVPRREPAQFAERIVELLSDEPRRLAFARAARESALRFDSKSIASRWDNVLARTIHEAP